MTGSMLSDEAPRGADYPFAAPLERYVFSTESEIPAFAVTGRTPVLALGSNAAPQQLRRKFGDRNGHIPVSRAVLHDHVVVYSAHFTAYGALPATLFPFGGGTTFVAVTWLDQAQLAVMHASESVGVNYDYVELEKVKLQHDGDLHLDAPALIGAYVSRKGMLLHKEQPIRLAETASSGCPLPALTQPAALRFAYRRLGPAITPELDFAAFMQKIIDDEAFRRDCSKHLVT